MNDAVLQVLLILVYLAIGLISVTFPIYAISVSFLPQQKWESEKERKKRMGDLTVKISELTAQLKGDKKQVAQIREQLNKYEAEREGTELRYKYLTAWGAVGVPVGFLIFSLLCVGIGIYAFYTDAEQVVIVFGVLSATLSLAAIVRLYKTISAVEYGALRPERTVEFQVGFGTPYHKMKEMKLKKQTTDLVNVRTDECDVENVVVQLSFPTELGATRGSASPRIIFGEDETQFLIRWFHDYLPKSMGIGLAFDATPEKTGKYPVVVRICGKGIYEYRTELVVNVVS